jgi:hypothetical protein
MQGRAPVYVAVVLSERFVASLPSITSSIAFAKEEASAKAAVTKDVPQPKPAQ